MRGEHQLKRDRNQSRQWVIGIDPWPIDPSDVWPTTHRPIACSDRNKTERLRIDSDKHSLSHLLTYLLSHALTLNGRDGSTPCLKKNCARDTVYITFFEIDMISYYWPRNIGDIETIADIYIFLSPISQRYNHFSRLSWIIDTNSFL